MAKNRLQVEYDFDFLVLAINSNVKPYKLAWAINQELGIDLAKEVNIEIGFTGKKSLMIQNFLDFNEFRTIRLIRNRAEEIDSSFNAYLLPELKNFDYFILLENESNTFDENAFITQIKKIPFVQFSTKINIQTLKSKDNLIF